MDSYHSLNGRLSVVKKLKVTLIILSLPYPICYKIDSYTISTTLLLAATITFTVFELKGIHHRLSLYLKVLTITALLFMTYACKSIYSLVLAILWALTILDRKKQRDNRFL